MPSRAPRTGATARNALVALGARLRTHRRALGITATVTAEAAGVSRMTLYRIERGDASVTMGAYMGVVAALGLEVELFDPAEPKPRAKPTSLPKRIKLADYPQLKKLAWQLADTHSMTPKEALALYERNWRHVDKVAMSDRERELVRQLVQSHGGGRPLV